MGTQGTRKLKKQSKKGFTMVELIVVIVIILILGAFLVPSLLKYIEKSKHANCRSSMSTMTKEYAIGVADSKITQGDTDLKKLQASKAVSSFICPSKGVIYIMVETDKNDKNEKICTVRCTYHDDNIKVSGNGSPGQITLSKFQEIIKNWTKADGYMSNDTVVKAFLAKYGKEGLEQASIDDVIPESKLDDFITSVAQKTGKSENDIRKAFDSFKEKAYYAEPYMLPNGEVVMYYATNQLQGQNKTHDNTNLICYNNEWYFLPTMDGNNFDPKYALATLYSEFNKGNADQYLADNYVKIK